MPAPSCGHPNLNGIECESCELTEIETQLEELHKRHHQALVKRNYVHSPLIHQFPFEINTYIFLLAFPPQEACPRCSITPREKASPLVLTKVCHTWRAMALSTPRLWSCISFDINKPNFPLLNHQIAHSGAVPLTVFLALGYGSDQELANAKQAISLAIKQLHRVVSLYLLFTEEVAMACGSISDSDYPKTAPLLEDLHFHFLDDGLGSPFEFRLAIEPPRPRQVTLDSISFDQICLDWSNVSSLTLNSCHVHMVPPTLKSLEHLVLEHTRWDRPGEQPPIVNHSIQHVSLEESDDGLMLSMTLPSLRTLDVNINSTETFGIVCDFLLRSLCPLQALHIHYADEYDNDDATRVIQALLGVLEITKELQHLTLRFLADSFINIPSSDFEPLVRRFSESSQNRGFLPHLQTLNLETPSMPPIDLLLDAMLLDPFPSEIPNGPNKERPLCTLNLELCIPLVKVGPIRLDVLVRILQIRASGKKISITCTEWGRKDLVEHWKSSYGNIDG